VVLLRLKLAETTKHGIVDILYKMYIIDITDAKF
jgi:hypothetical protein